MGPEYRGNETDFVATVHESGVTVMRFKVNPSYLLFKIRDCNDILVKGYPPGIRENGGQYTHAACWFAKALALLGRNEDAAQVLEWLTPVWHTRSREETDRYMVEPYVIAADVYFGEPHTGRGGWTWYTGSAAWFYRVVLETLLGFSIANGDEVLLRPRVPSTWPGFQLRYRHGNRGTFYEIEASRSEGIGSSLDGAPLEIVDGVVRFQTVDDGKTHSVALRLG
jgi:cyclic beta-1,2-glucan synthetase